MADFGRSLIALSWSGYAGVYLNQQAITFYGGTDTAGHPHYDAVAWRRQIQLHFHGLEHDNHLVGRNPVADRHVDLGHRPEHWSEHLSVDGRSLRLERQKRRHVEAKNAECAGNFHELRASRGTHSPAYKANPDLEPTVAKGACLDLYCFFVDGYPHSAVFVFFGAERYPPLLPFASQQHGGSMGRQVYSISQPPARETPRAAPDTRKSCLLLFDQ